MMTKIDVQDHPTSIEDEKLSFPNDPTFNTNLEARDRGLIMNSFE